MHDDPVHFGCVPEPEVYPRARLRNETLSRMHGSNQRHGIACREIQLDPCADGIPINGLSVALKLYGEEMVLGFAKIAKKANSGRRAVGRPEVEVAVKVPVANRDAAAVVQKVKTRRGRCVREAIQASRGIRPAVQEKAVAFASTEGSVLVQKSIERAIPAGSAMSTARKSHRPVTATRPVANKRFTSRRRPPP